MCTHTRHSLKNVLCCAILTWRKQGASRETIKIPSKAHFWRPRSDLQHHSILWVLRLLCAEGRRRRGSTGPLPGARPGLGCCWVIGSTKSHTINHNSHTRLSSWEWWPPFPADYKQCHLLLVHTRQHIDFVCYEKKLTLGNQKDFKKISIPHKYLA